MKLTRALALIVVFGIAACAPAANTPPPSPTPRPAPAATASPPLSASPTGPGPTPTAGLLAGAVALYSAGPWDSPELYALAADGTATDLGLQVAPDAVASPGGHWVAYRDSAKVAGDMIVRHLQDGRTYTIAHERPGADVITAPAFAGSDRQLAYVEVGPAGDGGVPWAIVVVDLQDGSTRCFGTTRPWGQMAALPGAPLGWSAQGELLLDTFVPYSEGAFQGLWALTLPSEGAPDAEDLPRRQLLAGGTYMWPQLSPDGTRLLYLARDRGYTPAGYETEYIDTAVNQLWSLDMASGQATLLAEVTDGGALGPATWSSAGGEVLFSQGRYSGGDRLGSLVLKACAAGSAVREVGPLPIEGDPWSLLWPRPGQALALSFSQNGAMALYGVDMAGGGVTRLAEAPYIHLLGCVP